MAPAKITDRFLAYLIDTIPFGIAYYFSLFFLTVRLKMAPLSPQQVSGLIGIWIVLYVLYHAIGNRFGGTIGKKLFGIEVVGPDGERLAVGGCLIRAIGLLLSTPLFNLGFLWAFVNSQSRTWHDLLADSWVVETHPKTARQSRINAFLSFALLAVIVGGTIWFDLFRPTPSDIEAIGRARRGLKILAQIEETYKAEHGTYTDRLADLAQASGNVEQFKTGMLDLFDADDFRILTNRDRYRFNAHAKDRRKTPVTLTGPD